MSVYWLCELSLDTATGHAVHVSGNSVFQHNFNFYSLLLTNACADSCCVCRENLLADCLQGCFVVTCTLCAFISLVWLREQIVHGGAPQWLEQHQPPPQNAAGQANEVRVLVKICLGISFVLLQIIYSSFSFPILLSFFFFIFLFSHSGTGCRPGSRSRAPCSPASPAWSSSSERCGAWTTRRAPRPGWWSRSGRRGGSSSWRRWRQQRSTRSDFNHTLLESTFYWLHLQRWTVVRGILHDQLLCGSRHTVSLKNIHCAIVVFCQKSAEILHLCFKVADFCECLCCRWHELECVRMGQSSGGAHMGEGNFVCLTLHVLNT